MSWHSHTSTRIAFTPPPIVADSWLRAVNVMRTSFTGVFFARGRSLIATVIGRAMSTMDESNSSKEKVGGLVFRSSLMLLAAQFLNWMFEMTL